MTHLIKLVPGAVSCALLLSILCSTPDTTHAYILNHWVFDAAGGPSTSTNYRNLSVVAQSTPLGVATSTGYRNYPGFLHGVAAEGQLLPDYTVSLYVTGSGTGLVTSFPVGIQCNINCSASFNSYFPVTLTPTADPYMIFSGWSGGGCNGTDPCTMSLSDNTSVTAVFDKDSGHSVYLPGAGTYFSTLQAAYDGAADGSTIRAWDISYHENLSCAQAKQIVFKGGYDQSYINQTGYTTLNGTFTIKQGKVVAERIKVKGL